MADTRAVGPVEERAAAPERPFDPSEGGFLSNGAIALLIFLLGIVTGFPAATIGVAFFIDNAVPVFGGLIGILVVALAVIGLIIAFRKRIWAALFKRGEVEAGKLATPLTNFARFATEQKLAEATNAARELAEMAIARYAWIMTRRWMLATLTALVAAIAALAGAALLFQQNQLLRVQGELFAEQNLRISEQTTLLQAQIQLGEAQRSTSIVPEILAIGAAIGAETAVLATDGRPAQVFGAAEFSLSLRARIIAATNAARPYRHLVSSLAGLNEIEIVAAALKRRTDLPTTIADYETWRASQPLARPLAELGEPSSELTDREVSPERGQLISLLYNSRILDTEELSYNGADFSFAELRQPVLGAMSFRHAKLRFADFSGVEVRGTNFGGASLDHARFRGATIVETDFAGIPGADIEPPYLANPAVPVWWTLLNGADFSSSFIDRSKFGSTRAFAANFDSAYVGNSDFSNAALGASTFRNAIIDDCLFEGANMSSVDFSGAIVFDAAFLDKLAAAAASQSFVRERFALEPAPFEVVDTHPQAMNMDPAIIGGIADGSIPAFRVVRVGEFESDPGRATQAID